MSQRQHRYADIERDSEVSEGHLDWTEGKEAAAQNIQELIDAGEWPVPLSHLADETNWSRAHYQNTIRDLFSEKQQETEQESDGNVTISVPDDVDRMSYLRGWIDCEKQRNGQ